MLPKITKFTIALLLSWTLAAIGNAGEPRDIAFTSQLDGTTQRYVELLPATFDAEKTYDAVLALHGHGSDRWQFIKNKRDECKGVRDVAAKQELILVSPDYRAKTSWMGPKAEADVMQIIAELKTRHRINRVFIVGGSMGGASALIFASLHPQIIAGVCSLNGTANMLEYERFQDAIQASYGGTKEMLPDEYKKRSPELRPERFNMPVAFTTGGKDSTVPPDSVLRLVEKLKQTAVPVLSIHRPEGGHSTNTKTPAKRWSLCSVKPARRLNRERRYTDYVYLRQTFVSARFRAERLPHSLGSSFRDQDPIRGGEAKHVVPRRGLK